MGRPAIKHQARLARLEAAKPKVMALPRGELLTSQPMSQILGVRWPSLREWCDEIEGFEDSGAFERGSNGLAYEFCPVRTLWFLIDHFRGLVEKDTRKAQAINAIALGAEGSPGDGLSLDLDEMRKVLDLQDRILTTRERAGQLVDARKTAGALRAVFSRMQEVAIVAPQELDPSGQWPADTRKLVDKAMQAMLLKQRAAAREVLQELKQETE